MNQPQANSYSESATAKRGGSIRFSLGTLFLLAIPVALGVIGFQSYWDQRPTRWIKYSKAEFDAHRKEGHTVLVNFRATWTPSLVMHESIALDQPAVRRWIRRHDVIPMQADFTHQSPEVKAALQSIGKAAVPVIAIFSGNEQQPPILLSDQITKDRVLKALQKAERNVAP